MNRIYNQYINDPTVEVEIRLGKIHSKGFVSAVNENYFNISQLDLLTNPPTEVIKESLDLLISLGYLELDNKSNLKITEIGIMSKKCKILTF